MKISNKTVRPTEGFDLESLMETLFYRDEFLSIASHELKTPLTTIKLHAQMFKRTVEKENDKAYTKENVDRLVEQIDAQSSRMVRLVNDMLDITRIRSGQLIMTKKQFNLSDLVNEMLGRFNQNEISFKIDSNVFIFGDCERIEQVIFKLLNNAAKYGRGQPIEVKLVKMKSKISFSIRDQGLGISEEDQKRIFHRFQRAVAASEVSGLGLGLYIAREIVEAHNGKIKVKSLTGQGSTFTVDLKREELV